MTRNTCSLSCKYASFQKKIILEFTTSFLQQQPQVAVLCFYTSVTIVKSHGEFLATVQPHH